MRRPRDYTERAERNDKSRNTAKHHTEPWDGWEVELLMSWSGDEDELTYIAEELGRTIEACRQRFYVARHNGVCKTPDRTTTTTSTAHWSDDDDRAWPSDWYVR